MVSKPKVSILCLAYNQKQYIRQCLDSLLIQKTNFNFEILINDDASTDGTTEIVKEYQLKHPDTIRLVLHRENQYSKGSRNFIARFLLPKAQGKYIAICEGDDYWTKPTKLQQQVDFLEKNKNYTLCFHPVCIIDEKSDKENRVYPEEKPELTVSELLKRNFIQTNSVVYRKQEYKNIAYDLMPADWYLHLYHAQYGKIGFIDRVMSVYRRHDSGIWSGAQDDKVNFWSQYGYLHLMFFYRVLEMYGSKKQHKDIIYNNVGNMTNMVLEFAKDGQTTISKLINDFPDFAMIIIQGQAMRNQDLQGKIEKRDSDVTELQKAFEAKQVEIDDIKSSKIWKVRDRAARVLGKKKV